MNTTDSAAQYQERRAQMLAGGGEKRTAQQHAKGKQTARERIAMLVDHGSFIAHQSYIRGRATDSGFAASKFYGDGVVGGTAKIASRQVFLYSQDFTILGGSLGEMHAVKIAEIQEMALRNGCPMIQINDSGGARIQEGVLSLNGYARIFRNNTHASGVVPQFSVILGPCAGGAVYSPAITDFIFMVDGVSQMYITGPDVIKSVTGEQIAHDALGGPGAHSTKSGVAHFRFANEQDCMSFIQRLLSYLPANNLEHPPVAACNDPLDRNTARLSEIVPTDDRAAYDVRDCIEEIVDRDSFIEVQAEWAQNVVIGFARLGGRTVGLFANQPKVYAAALDINASDKGARFLRFCDSFNIPIISLVDVPGFLPGVNQEHTGIIRHGAKILYAIAEATVPKVALIMRKAYGGAFISMASKALGYDRVLAFPTAQIAVMGAEGAANIIFRRDIEAAEDPAALRQQKIDHFRESVMTPFIAAEYGFIDDIIDPAATRVEILKSLEMHAAKTEHRPQKKHGNIPL